jgi:hypothetical protein
MAQATFNLIDEFYNDLLKGVHTFGAAGHTFKIRLSDVAPVKATDALIAAKTPITGGTYSDQNASADGKLTISEPSTGVWQIGDTDDSARFTATGSDFAQARYAYLYNDTAANKNIVGVMDFGSAFTVTAGNYFDVDPGANGYARFTTPTWA